MLYKNGQLKTLDQKEINAFKKEFNITKFPVTFQYVDKLFKKQVDANGRVKTVSPQAASLPTSESVKTATGTEQWIYCETTQGATEVNGMKVIAEYQPRRIYISKLLALHEDKIELIYFLLKFSKNVKGGANADKESNYLIEYLEKGKKATESISPFRAKAQAEAYLFLEDKKLPFEKLKMCATMLLIDGVNEMETEDEVISAIHFEITQGRDAAAKMKEFIKYASTKLTPEEKVLYLVQRAVDNRIVIFETGSRSWYYTDSDGKADAHIVKSKGTASDPMQNKKDLVQFLIREKEELETLEQALAAKKLVEAGEDE